MTGQSAAELQRVRFHRQGPWHIAGPDGHTACGLHHDGNGPPVGGDVRPCRNCRRMLDRLPRPAHDCSRGIHDGPAYACYRICGCRCTGCHRERRTYDRRRNRQIAYGRWDPWTEGLNHVRDHLAALSEAGVGYKTVAAAADVAKSSVLQIIDGRDRARTETVEALLALDPDDDTLLADGAIVDAGETNWRIGLLLRGGFSQAAIGRWVTGNPDAGALQVHRGPDAQVQMGTVRRIRRLYEDWSRSEVMPRDLEGDCWALTGRTSCGECGGPTEANARLCDGCWVELNRQEAS